MVDGPTVELVHGDLFESDARLLVALCSVTGSMSAEVRNQVVRLGATPPSGSFAPGQVIAHDTAYGTTVLFAMVAGKGLGEGEGARIVRTAASQVGTFATGADIVAVPLLGAGAGGLPPEQSMR